MGSPPAHGGCPASAHLALQRRQVEKPRAKTELHLCMKGASTGNTTTTSMTIYAKMVLELKSGA
uniref:Uncharacterized protein n=1 Tax=Nelumbo nucifera TaxID=4432 RepID=A0A822ZCT3_NELNU|nr:TPA_asm: hypothetical protein HUJ06_015149 [Nelumbo nucifera]